MTDEAGSRDNLGATRLLIGLAQGIALLLLTKAVDTKMWPSTDPVLFNALMLSTCYVMTTTLVAVGQLRPLGFVTWVLGALALIAVTAWHAVAREIDPARADHALLFAALAPVFFVAYHLIAAADADRRPIASYRTYFDIGWKNGVQLALSLAFVGALWLLLFLGAVLFELIKISAVRSLIERDWFAYPITAVMFALAVHITDVRVNLINGIRNVSLVLLSWLLPVMTLLAIAFLAALPATGLAPLWATTHATPILLVAAGALVVLINAAYQDGDAAAHWLLRIAARVASLALSPLVALAIYSVWLRIQQHGLSPDRVIAALSLVVATCYALGYGLAAIWPGRWLKPLEITNVVTAAVAVALAAAILTPVADPARLAVDDQLRRLRAGLIAPEQFDFAFLRDQAARYGRDALRSLTEDKSSPRAVQIAALAADALKPVASQRPEPPMKELLAKIRVHPGNGPLPDSFINQDWPNKVPANCPLYGPPGKACHAFLIDFDGDGATEIVIMAITTFQVYRQSSDGRWRVLGYFDQSYCGFSTEEALESGRYRLMPAREIEFNGHRMRLQGCPEEPPSASGAGTR